MPEDFYDADSEKEENVTTAKKGRPRKFKPVEEFFIELCRLRGGFSERHLAHLYGVAHSTISRLFVPWINFMYLKFGQVCIWPSKLVVQATMPADFKEKFPSTRVIIDFTEVFCEMPSSLLLNSELFSSYKNHVTLKGLVGIAPSGGITFVSQLYTGSISDREIVLRSGILSQSFDGDSVMADEGFQIQDILPLGVDLNIPLFLGSDAQMSAEDGVRTQQIASLRIHIERAINKIRNFRIWNGVVPLSLVSVVNQMWTVSAFLCNTQDPLISNITWSVYAYCFTKWMLLTFILVEIFFKPVLVLSLFVFKTWYFEAEKIITQTGLTIVIRTVIFPYALGSLAAVARKCLK